MGASVPDLSRRVRAAALAGVVLAVAGCGGDGGGGSRGDSPSTDTVATSGAYGGARGASPADSLVPGAEPDTVNVRLTEYRIQMPRSLPAGPTVLRVTNSGAVEHNLELRGEGPTGLREKFARNLHPTQTRNLRLDLEPGKYKVFCPVGGHLHRGGLLVLEVREAASSGEAEG